MATGESFEVAWMGITGWMKRYDNITYVKTVKMKCYVCGRVFNISVIVRDEGFGHIVLRAEETLRNAKYRIGREVLRHMEEAHG